MSCPNCIPKVNRTMHGESLQQTTHLLRSALPRLMLASTHGLLMKLRSSSMDFFRCHYPSSKLADCSCFGSKQLLRSGFRMMMSCTGMSSWMRRVFQCLKTFLSGKCEADAIFFSSSSNGSKETKTLLRDQSSLDLNSDQPVCIQSSLISHR